MRRKLAFSHLANRERQSWLQKDYKWLAVSMRWEEPQTLSPLKKKKKTLIKVTVGKFGPIVSENGHNIVGVAKIQLPSCLADRLQSLATSSQSLCEVSEPMGLHQG